MPTSNVRGHVRRYRGHTRVVHSHLRHLYTNRRERAQNLRSFKARYGKRGPEVFGAVVGKVRREQVAAGKRSNREWVAPHTSHSRTGRREHVKGHYARVRA